MITLNVSWSQVVITLEYVLEVLESNHKIYVANKYDKLIYIHYMFSTLTSLIDVTS